jgi:hypothetical protein
MIKYRRFRIGINDAPWYISTTGGNNEVFTSFIRFTTRLYNEFHGAALEDVLVSIGFKPINWNPMKQAVV